MARGFTVYRVDYRTGAKEAIGCILDRRESNRGEMRNLLDLLKEARRLFARGPGDATAIVLDPPRNAVVIRRKAVSREIHAIASGTASGSCGGRNAPADAPL